MAGTDVKIDPATIGKLAWDILVDSAPVVHAGGTGAVAVIPKGASLDDIHGPKRRMKFQLPAAEWEHPEAIWHKEERGGCIMNVEWEAGGTFNGHGAYIRDALIYASDISAPRGFRLEAKAVFHDADIGDDGVASLQFKVSVEGGSKYGSRSTIDYTGSISGNGEHLIG